MIYIRSTIKDSSRKTNYCLLLICSLVYGFFISGMFYMSNIQFCVGGLFNTVCAFIGYNIGKWMRNYIGNAYLSSNGNVEGAFKEKIQHQFGAQVKYFLLFGLCQYLLAHMMVYVVKSL